MGGFFRDLQPSLTAFGANNVKWSYGRSFCKSCSSLCNSLASRPFAWFLISWMGIHTDQTATVNNLDMFYAKKEPYEPSLKKFLRAKMDLKITALKSWIDGLKIILDRVLGYETIFYQLTLEEVIGKCLNIKCFPVIFQSSGIPNFREFVLRINYSDLFLTFLNSASHHTVVISSSRLITIWFLPSSVKGLSELLVL